MNHIPVGAALLALALASCTYADVKGRELLRLGPLRDVRASAHDVDSVVTVDAGTDALTDAELLAVERALAPALTASFARLGGVPLGHARVGACKLRAGPSERFVVYVAKCHVSLVVDGVSVIEVQSEALRRTQNVFVRTPARPSRAAPPAGAPADARDPAVDARESQAVLEDALDAAARLIVDGPLPAKEGERAPLPRAQRAALARERLARAASTSETVAALFDLRSAGSPADARLALPLLDVHPSSGDAANGARDPVVVAAALDAVGELCDPGLRPRVDAVPEAAAEGAPVDEAVARAKARALSRLRACAALPR